MKSVAIITARGGSKRIPKKNIKDFLGKPIISYSIEAAIKSGCFEEVMVSTDDKEIVQVAKDYGASVPFLRSEENSNDYATSSDVLFEVLNEYSKREKKFEIFACIYPTAPFVTDTKLKDAFNLFNNSNCDSLISVTRFSYPPQRAFVKKDRFIVFQHQENANIRSQDLETIYHDAGQFYICYTNVFLEHQSLILPRTIPYIIPETEVQDIDNESDWQIAELKYKYAKMMQGGISNKE